MNFDRLVTDTTNPPAFTSLRAAEDWLTRLPAANPQLAQAELQTQLLLLARYTLAVTERWTILEALRGPLLDVQVDMAQRFAARPLPLSAPEQAALQSTQALWQASLTNHLHCLAGSASLPADLSAAIAQRVLALLADWQYTLICAQQLPPAIYWRQLNQLLMRCEASGLISTPVADPLRHGSLVVSPLAAFAECQLLYAASPFELPARHIGWVARWARRWGGKISLLATPPEDIRGRAHPLWVDLASAEPASYMQRKTSDGRWLDTTELRHSLEARIHLLDQGRAPATLQLGEDITQPAAGELLRRLLQRWCKGGFVRGMPRQPVNDAARAACEYVIGLDNVHFQFSGRRLFQPPAQDDASLRRQREEMETFGGHRHTQADKTAISIPLQHGELLVDSLLADQSGSGLRLRRPLRSDVRIGPGMLIAVRRPPATGFTLGAVRWVLASNDDSMNFGVKLFVAATHPAAARLLDPEPGPWRPCLLLSDSNGDREEHSIILPVGSFRLDRTIEIMGKNTARIRLTHLLDRGSEFEHCSYER